MLDDDPENASALRAKAAHCISAAKIIETEETRIRLIQMASDYLVHAIQLEYDQKK